MKYKNGENIQRGDRVWWDDERGVAYIKNILDNEEAYTAEGLDCPSVLVSMAKGKAESIPFVAYTEEGIIQDGLNKICGNDALEVNQVLSFTANFLNNVDLDLIGLWRIEVQRMTYWGVAYYEKYNSTSYIINPSIDKIRVALSEEIWHFYLPFPDSGNSAS